MRRTQSGIEKLLEQRGALIDRELSMLSVRVEPPELAEVVRYALAQRGKKVRASLLTLACEAVGGSLVQALIPAAMVEMVHNTSIILDDVIDASDMRRGRKTVNVRWGNNLALIACDAMLALTIQQATRLDVGMTSALIESVSGSLLNLAEGEAMELVHSDHTVADYFKIADRKTAALFRSSAEVGALIGGGNADEVRALREYGGHIGVAFQVRDDILDFLSGDGATGKPGLVDLKMGRPNLVLLMAQEDGLSREKMLAMEYTELLQALAPSADCAATIAKEQVRLAHAELASVRDGPSKDMLVKLGDFIIARHR